MNPLRGMCAGSPGRHIGYVNHITDGMPIFLFHYTERRLYGVYLADGIGGWNLRPNAFSAGQGYSRFPAQVGPAFNPHYIDRTANQPEFSSVVECDAFGTSWHA